MIEYLIKFVKEEKYANMLIDGKLFMRCAKYYHNLETQKGAGQGDLREGIIFPNFAMYKNTDLPIYCLYYVEDDEIMDSTIRISHRVVGDFECENGFFVLLDFKAFESALAICDTKGFQMNRGKVSYVKPAKELSEKMMVENSARNLFIKDPYFAYQKEYRLVVYNPLQKKTRKSNWNGTEIDVLDVEQMKIVYQIPGGLDGVAQKYAISSLEREKDDYLLML